jgi:hypothetical protein
MRNIQTLLRRPDGSARASASAGQLAFRAGLTPAIFFPIGNFVAVTDK